MEKKKQWVYCINKMKKYGEIKLRLDMNEKVLKIVWV
jgi:hypothetical protein